MDNQYSNKAFKYSMISVFLFALNILWLIISLETLKLGPSIGGTVSGIILILFFIFNFKGLKTTYKGYKNNDSFNLIQKIGVSGNIVISIFPLALILLIVLELSGIDINGMLINFSK